MERRRLRKTHLHDSIPVSSTGGKAQRPARTDPDEATFRIQQVQQGKQVVLVGSAAMQKNECPLRLAASVPDHRRKSHRGNLAKDARNPDPLGRAGPTPYPVAMETRSTPPAPPSSDAANDLERTIERLAFGEPVLGERLLILGRGRPHIPHALGGAVATASDGNLVLVLGFSRIDASTAAAVADRLDRLASVNESRLEEIMERPLSQEELNERRRRYFSAATAAETEPPPPFNTDQRVLLLVRDPLSHQTWKALAIELGSLLGGVWQLGPGDPVPLQPPEELRRRTSPGRSFSWATLLATIVVLAGVVLGVLALTQGRPEQGAGGEVSAPVVEPPIRDVAFEVPADATHSQWIGQQRLLRTSGGKLVALYPTEDGLQVVTDQRNQGRSWRSPITFPQITATSISAAIDGDDNLHLGFSDGSAISYARLDAGARAWQAPVILPLDGDSGSPVVDIAWDEGTGSAHVVWAAESDDGQVARWSAVSAADDPAVVETLDLSDAGAEIDVLANIETGPRSAIHVTYRRGDSSLGWFARFGRAAPDGSVEWGPEERLASQEGFGAATLAVDAGGVAHLVLRDSTSFALLYFRRSPRGGWSGAQTAVDAEATVEIDFPSLSVDASSRLVFLFFQTSEFNPANEVAVSVRDPATGWEGPYRISPSAEGALYPVAIANGDGQPITLWTKGGAAPSIQAARIIAP